MSRFSQFVSLTVCMCLYSSSALQAQIDFPHHHQVIELESAPIINRIPLKTRQIRRIAEESDGSLLIAEWETGSLIRLSPEGESERIAIGLNQPSGVISSVSGEIFLTLYAAGIEGAGELVRIDSMGDTHRVLGGLNSPSDLVVSPQGSLVLCEYTTGRILQLDDTGEAELLTDEVASPTALAYDSAGTLYIASRTDGAIYRRMFDGSIERVQVGLQHPSDIHIHRNGMLIVLNSQTGLMTAWNPQTRKVVSYAQVPAETTCLCFDSENNFVIGHWEYNFLMRITRHLSLPCPHCNERIPLHLVPPVPAGSPEASL